MSSQLYLFVLFEKKNSKFIEIVSKVQGNNENTIRNLTQKK